MKNVMEWVKGHWLIIVLGVIAVAALPVALFFSLGVAKKLTEEVQTKAGEDYKNVTSTKVEYYVLTPTGEKVLVKSMDVNSPTTKQYAKWNEEISTQAQKQATEGEAFNKSDHGLLVEGLFPAPSELVRDSKVAEFIDVYKNRFHQALLSKIGAGMPPDPVAIAQQMAQHVEDARTLIRNERGSAEFSPDESAKLQRELFAIRVENAKRRASEISVYGDVNVFSGVAAIDANARPTLAMAWDLQERAWLHSDVIKAVGKANNSENGTVVGGVPSSIVKRIVRVAPSRSVYETGSAVPFEQGVDKVPQDFTKSLTGRFSGPGSQNKWYDVRDVDLEIIVSSQRLPAFIDSLGATNFISVLDLDIQSLDVFEELKAGFYYGDENVVRATLKLESIYLRSWRSASMPQDVQAALGMSEGVPGDPSAAPAPPPRRAAPVPAEGGGRRPRGGDIPDEGT